MSTPGWYLVIDVAECTNCHNCMLAAKDELVGNAFPGYTRPHPAQGTGVIRIERHVRGSAPMADAAYVPRLCNHCDDAPCLKVGADGAVRKRPDGIVIFDPVKAKGRRDLVDACPYDAVIWNEAEQLPQTCFFDAHLLDQGAAAPRCVPVCPTRAIEAVKTEPAAMAARVAAEGLRPLRPEWGTAPRVFYRHLHRADHLFIGGSVTALVNGVVDCVEGAEVQLRHGDRVVAEARTDAFGDFKFDGQPPAAGACEVRVRDARFGEARCTAELVDRSLYLGEIALTPA